MGSTRADTQGHGMGTIRGVTHFIAKKEDSKKMKFRSR